MIFNDYFIEFDAQKEILEKLDFITKDVKKILKLHENWVTNAFSDVYLRRIHSNTSNGTSRANALVDNTAKYFIELREILISIDFLEFGELLNNLNHRKISSLEKKNKMLCDDFKNAYRAIHDFKKLTDNSERAKQYNDFINALNRMVSTYDSFMFMVDYMNEINLGLNKGIEADTFEIRLLNETFDKDTYGKITNPMYTMYEKLCEIANINNEPLKIVRVESGSFLINFFGNESILKVIGKFFESSHNLWVRNFTRDGKKQNIVESTELLKEQLDLVHEMREVGLDVDEHYKVANETLVLLMKQSNILLSSSPDVKINKKVLSKSQEIKKTLENKEFTSLPVNEEAV